MNLYPVFYAGKQHEVTAKTPWEAKESIIAKLKIPKSKQGLISTILVEVDGQPIVVEGASL